MLLGSGPACDLRLRDRTISRRHAALDVRAEGLRIVDLGSRNGTRVNGVRISDAFLVGGETVQLGDTPISVTRGAPTNNPKPPIESQFGHMVGASLEMRRLYPLCQRLAAADIPVIIEGETGVGKEVLARALHEAGPRQKAPFVVFDCTAVPPNLVESELFGHARGAFTGASAERKGVFARADTGTIFIDEIGDLDLPLQAKLLRVIERSEFRPVGSDEMQRVDVRIIAATRRDLDREVQAGRFRDDLFHRLAVARVELPPLRDRKGDIPLLAQHFATQAGAPLSALPADVLTRWAENPFPGNVRELKNAVLRFLVLGELGRVPAQAVLDDSASAGDWLQELLALDLPISEARDEALRVFEKRYIERALSQTGGNVTQAARAAGVGRRYFQTLKSRRLKKD
jgi:DNA-binding NtrC family response regulator